MTGSRVDAYQAVADPARRALLDQLRGGEAAVNDLVARLAAAGFGMSRPAVSRHLRVLRAAGLVCERRGGVDGRQRLYTVTPAPLREVARWALAYQRFWDANLSGLKRHLERPEATTAVDGSPTPEHSP